MVEIFDNTKIYNVPEAAGILRISPSTLRGYVSQRSIPHLKFGSGKSNVRFTGEMLNGWLKKKSISEKTQEPLDDFHLNKSISATKGKKRKETFNSYLKDAKSKKKDNQ